MGMTPALGSPCRVGLRALDGGDEPIRWADQGFDDVPALLPGGGDDASQDGEVLGPLLGSEASGDLLAQLHHPQVALGLVVCEPYLEVGQEPEHRAPVVSQPQGQIVTDPSLPAFLPLARRERRLALVEGQRLGNDLVRIGARSAPQASPERRHPCPVRSGRRDWPGAGAAASAEPRPPLRCPPEPATPAGDGRCTGCAPHPPS